MSKSSDLDARVATALGTSPAVSMHPVARQQKPKAEEVVRPDIRTLMPEPDASNFARLCEQSADYAAEIKLLTADRGRVTGELKKLLEKYPEVKAGIAGSVPFDYYEQTRTKIDGTRLMQLGVSPRIIADATIESTSSVLRVGAGEG